MANVSPFPPHSDESQEMRRAIFGALPGFDWCGGCGTATREITEQEATDTISMLYLHVLDGGSAVETLDGATWFMETFQRYRLRGTCRCRREAKEVVPNDGFYLYRLWSADDRLLYVGVSVKLRARLRTHRRKMADLIDHVTWEEHLDAASMLVAELEAIRSEHPALNKAGVG